MDRKDFLKATLGICGLAVAPSALLQSCKKNDSTAPTNVNLSLDLSTSAYSTLNTVGGYVVTNGLIIFRLSTSEIIALSASCTHEGCTVTYDAANTRLRCPCHNGIFNTSGGVVSGPPPSALAKYTTSLSGNILTVKS